MKRQGTVEQAREIEKCLLTILGVQVKNETGDNGAGDLDGFGITDPNVVRVMTLSVPIYLLVTFLYDARGDIGAVQVRDDNLGRLVIKRPPIMGMLNEMELVGYGHPAKISY